jgi:hypothetical protein
VDILSTYALAAVACGVFYSLPLGKALDIFIALALYVKVHVVPTCIAKRLLSELPRDRVKEWSPRDREWRVTRGSSLVIILLNGDEVGINTVCLCDVCVCARA